MFFSRFEPEVDLPPQWIFPGGGIESGETPIEAALRELKEETGLDFADNALQQHPEPLLFEFDSKLNFDTGTAWFFKTEVESEFDPSKELWTEDEHRDTVMHRWLDLSEIASDELWVGPAGSIALIRDWLA